jgi:hypothetical protein
LFSTADLELIRRTAERFPGLSLTEPAQTICESLPWKVPNGQLKVHACCRCQGFVTSSIPSDNVLGHLRWPVAMSPAKTPEIRTKKSAIYTCRAAACLSFLAASLAHFGGAGYNVAARW